MEPEKNSPNKTPAGDDKPPPIAEPVPSQPTIEPVAPVIPAPGKGEFTTQPAQQQPTQKSHDPLKPLLVRVIEDDELSKFERTTLRYGVLGIFVAFLALVAACVTAYFINGQFKEMSNQTGILSASFEKQKQDSAAAAITTAQQLSIAQKQAKAAQNSVLTLERQMELTERPWIKIELGEKGDEEKIELLQRVGDPLTIPIRLTNTGNTPAKHIVAAIQIQIVPKGKEPRPPRGHLIKLASSPNDVTKKDVRGLKEWHALPGFGITSGRLFAGAHISAKVARAGIVDGKAVPIPLTVEEATDLVHKNTYVMMSGEGHYFDGFGVEHWTRFCNDFFMDGEAGTNKNCVKYAEDDNNWSGKTTKIPN